jgi:hypothetical protein
METALTGIQSQLAEWQKPTGPIDTSLEKGRAFGDIGAGTAGRLHLAAERGARTGMTGGQIERGISEAGQTRMARAATDIEMDAARRQQAMEEARKNRVLSTMGLGAQVAGAAGAGERAWADVGTRQYGAQTARQLGERGQDISLRGQDISQAEAEADRKMREMAMWQSMYGMYGLG